VKQSLRVMLLVLIAAIWCPAVAGASFAVRPIWHPEQAQPTSVTDPTGGTSSRASTVPQASSPVALTSILAGGSTTCSAGWNYVAAQANSYVTGNCNGSWPFTASYVQYDSIHNWYWYAGAIGGDYNGCGWMRSQDLGAFGGYSSSTCSNRAYCDYIYCDSTGPYTYGSADDGMPASSIAGCTEWANFRPWSSSPAPKNSLRLTTGGVDDLRVRYLAKPVYGGHRYYMARDTKVAAGVGAGNWVFLRDDCFS